MTADISSERPLHPILSSLGFSKPTPIQSEAIPILERGESLLGLAPTGSGKTLAFLIPLMQRIDLQASGIRLLVISPTRELGVQIAQVAAQVAEQLACGGARALQIRTVFGGQKAENQKAEILKNPDVVIATAGRALELIEQEVLKTEDIKALVLDEADVMVGMGFEPQVKAICDHLPRQIQAALFSATESEGQSRLQNRLVHRGKIADVRNLGQCGEGASEGAAAQTTTHEVLQIANGQDRITSLGEL